MVHMAHMNVLFFRYVVANKSVSAQFRKLFNSRTTSVGMFRNL
jgi:hypothetical protein